MLSYRTIEPNTLELLNKLSQLSILSEEPQGQELRSQQIFITITINDLNHFIPK